MQSQFIGFYYIMCLPNEVKVRKHWGSCFKFAPWQPENLSSKFNYTVWTRSDFMSFSWITQITMENIADEWTKIKISSSQYGLYWCATEISIPDGQNRTRLLKKRKKIIQHNRISLPHLNRSVKSLEWSIALHECLYLEHVKL